MEDKKPQPLFTPRKDGSGWNLNIGSRTSYIIIAIILTIPFLAVAISMFLARK
jgi:uncharacterized membrane protein